LKGGGIKEKRERGRSAERGQKEIARKMPSPQSRFKVSSMRLNRSHVLTKSRLKGRRASRGKHAWQWRSRNNINAIAKTGASSERGWANKEVLWRKEGRGKHGQSHIMAKELKQSKRAILKRSACVKGSRTRGSHQLKEKPAQRGW